MNPGRIRILAPGEPYELNWAVRADRVVAVGWVCGEG